MRKDDVLSKLINQAGIGRELILFDVEIGDSRFETIEYNPKHPCLLKYNEKYLYLMYLNGQKEIEFEKIFNISWR